MNKDTFRHGKFEVTVTWNEMSDDAVARGAQVIADKLAAERGKRSNEESRG